MNEWEWQLLEDKTTVPQLEIAGVQVKTGDRVRLHPRKGGDIMDIALQNQVATIEAIEQDYEGKFHVCVVLDLDPGRDMGLMRQPGHRFFFDADEVEPLLHQEDAQQSIKQTKSILVAGIGNIFMGDDAFGVEVAQRLAARQLPDGVRVVDFSIRGYDLANALQDGFGATILVDAYPHGDAPGTLYLVEPDLEGLNSAPAQDSEWDAHSMDPVKVLRLAASMGGPLKRILLLGCEPATLGPEQGQMGLSPEVDRAVEEAVSMLDSLINKILAGEWPTKEA